MPTTAAAFVQVDATQSSGTVGSTSVTRRTVLLVEDDDIIAGLVAHILRRAGRHVLRARDGEEAVRFFLENVTSIALVILDCRLPDWDGLDLRRELRRHAADVPVLLTSGRDHSVEDLSGDGGRTVFLRKPFRPVEVEQQVSSLLGAIA
jgi:DNA-binding response OmpR family regulator